MRYFNLPKSNVILMPLKMLKHHNNEEKRSKTLKLFVHVIQTYHQKPYSNVVKNILLFGI